MRTSPLGRLTVDLDFAVREVKTYNFYLLSLMPSRSRNHIKGIDFDGLQKKIGDGVVSLSNLQDVKAITMQLNQAFEDEVALHGTGSEAARSLKRDLQRAHQLFLALSNQLALQPRDQTQAENHRDQLESTEATLDNPIDIPAASSDALDKLARDPSWEVRKALAANPSVSAATLDKLGQDSSWEVRKAVGVRVR